MFSIERLETRRMFAASVEAILVITGTSGEDEITVERDPTNSKRIRVTVNDEVSDFRASRVDGIVVKGGKGEDVITVAENVRIPATLIGGKGDDELVGGGTRDLILGGDGDDDLDGGPGKDRVFGQGGQDVFQSTDKSSEHKDKDDDDGVRIELDEAPTAVQTAVTTLLAGEEIGNLLRERDDAGDTVFELEWETASGQPHSAKINLAGEVVELEREIEISALPAAVVAAITAQYPDGEITEAEELELPNTPLRYEVEVENAGLVRELVLTPAGDILSDEVEGVVEE